MRRSNMEVFRGLCLQYMLEFIVIELRQAQYAGCMPGHRPRARAKYPKDLPILHLIEQM